MKDTPPLSPPRPVLCVRSSARPVCSAADLVDQCRATLHQSIPNPVQGLHIELLLRLDWHKTHVLFGYGFGDRFRIDEVVLVRLAVRLHKLGGDEPHFMTLFS